MKTYANETIHSYTYVDQDGNTIVTGLTKREYFAAMAMQGLILNKHDFYNAGSLSVEYADALIMALNRKTVV